VNLRGNPGVGGAPFQRVVSFVGGGPNLVFGRANKVLAGLRFLGRSLRWDIEPGVWGSLYGGEKARAYRGFELPLSLSVQLGDREGLGSLWGSSRWVVSFP
jgi:hypothetical protein